VLRRNPMDPFKNRLLLAAATALIFSKNADINSN
jgi:hypothetical protein